MLDLFKEKELLKSPQKQRTDSTHILAAIRTDGNYLLDLIWSNSELEWLRHLESVEVLRQVWIQQFYVDNGSLQLREAVFLPTTSDLN